MVMIPKIVHYCWFGEENYSPLIEKCINSWKDILIGYTFKKWTLKNFTSDNNFFNSAVYHKKYAFASDYARLQILYNEGGIYLDTDILLMKNLDALLNFEGFIGCQNPKLIAGGIIGSIPNNDIIKLFLERYNKLNFSIKNPPIIPNIISESFYNLGFESCEQEVVLINNFCVLPTTYFYPYPFPPEGNYKDYIKENTLGIHMWAGSWLNEWDYFRLPNYKKAFHIINKKLRSSKELPFDYYLKICYYVLRWPYAMARKKIGNIKFIRYLFGKN